MSPVILEERQATDPSVSFSGTSFGYPAGHFHLSGVVREKQKPIGLCNRVARAFRQSIRLFGLILRPYGTGPWLRPAALGIFSLSWSLRGERVGSWEFVSKMAVRYSDQPVAELTLSPSGSESRWSYSEPRLDHSEEQCR